MTHVEIAIMVFFGIVILTCLWERVMLIAGKIVIEKRRRHSGIINKLAREFYSIHGYTVKSNYDFYRRDADRNTPHLQDMMLRSAEFAYDTLEKYFCEDHK